MHALRTLAAPLALIALVAGCADDAALYPSLARRPAERVNGDAPPPPPPPAPPAAPDKNLLDRLERLVAQAREADAQFRAREGRANALSSSATGAAIGSEAWAVATIAVSDLESARSDAMIALAELDALYAAARIDGTDATAIAAARDQAIALVAGQDKALAALRSRLAG
jgi:hypothetical protein